jgi:lipopolysaccharide export system permease protein
MKILDKYIAKNFLVGYAIAFGVLIGLRIIIELFVNLDEFTEKADIGAFAVIKDILAFYGLRITLYFRDFAGMITVMAAAFSFSKMIRNGELIAVMASGVSLKRVVVPVIILSLFSTALFVIDQEFLIPPIADRLVRGEDELAGQKTYDIKFLNDAQGSLIFSPKYDAKTATLGTPTIILRKRAQRTGIWEVTGWVNAQQAVFNPKTNRWDLTKGVLTNKHSQKGPVAATFYNSDLTPRDIPVRRKAEFKSMLSWSQLRSLALQGSKIKDLAQLYAQMQSHITDPIMNLVMLLISLPILICRDPKTMKSAVIISFAITSLCFIITFTCKLFATEVFFDRIIPEFWVWLPVFIFLPLAVIELDSMKT